MLLCTLVHTFRWCVFMFYADGVAQMRPFIPLSLYYKMYIKPNNSSLRPHRSAINLNSLITTLPTTILPSSPRRTSSKWSPPGCGAASRFPVADPPMGFVSVPQLQSLSPHVSPASFKFCNRHKRRTVLRWTIVTNKVCVIWLVSQACEQTQA